MSVMGFVFIDLFILQANDGLGDDVDAEAQVVLNELILLTETEDNTDGRSQNDASEWGKLFLFLSSLHF